MRDVGSSKLYLNTYETLQVTTVVAYVFPAYSIYEVLTFLKQALEIRGLMIALMGDVSQKSKTFIPRKRRGGGT